MISLELRVGKLVIGVGCDEMWRHPNVRTGGYRWEVYNDEGRPAKGIGFRIVWVAFYAGRLK